MSAASSIPPLHPKGRDAQVLLTSVFGPYARDDEYGSRAINPMELYHNQVTRVQNVFSLRTFHRSWGLMLIQANIEAPCTLLDFPTLERFVEELRAKRYDPPPPGRSRSPFWTSAANPIGPRPVKARAQSAWRTSSGDTRASRSKSRSR